MEELKQFNKFDTAEAVMGSQGADCEDGSCNCKHLNITKNED